jgi:hypothetical protein
MASLYRALPGIPPYGPAVTSFPSEWGLRGKEGFVVEFLPESPASWVGNFCHGLGELEEIHLHPNGHEVVVIAAGDIWFVNPDARAAQRGAGVVSRLWEIGNPRRLVLCRQELAFSCIGSAGEIWHTRRLSWDGVDGLQISEGELSGSAWSPIENSWMPFTVDLRSGKSRGGSYSQSDSEGWERLAATPG